MNDARTVRRFRLWFILSLLMTLALGSFWVLEVIRREAGNIPPPSPRSEPDYYVEKFHFVKMSPTGQARYHVSGGKLTHHPQDDSYEIQQPIVSSLNNNRPPMTMHAERALINDGNNQVHLYDKVHLERPASNTAQPLSLRSDYLLLLPDEDVMQTDKAVEITVGKSTLTGKGLFANNATRQFRLTNKVRGTYQPAH